MKVIQINCVYGKGSTGKITRSLHHDLQQAGVDSIVCYGRGEKVTEPGVHKLCPEWYAKWNNLLSRATGLPYGGCRLSTGKLIWFLKREKPDVVHLQCLNGHFVNIYRLISWLNRNRIPTVLTLHAEFMYTANCAHAETCEKWKTGCGDCPRYRKETRSWLFDSTARSFGKMRRAFAGFGETLHVVSVSPWLRDRAAQSRILEGKKHSAVFNGVDTSIFHPVDAAQLRQKHSLAGEKVLLHVTTWFCDDPEHLKGGYYVCQLAKMLGQDWKILVAGRYQKSVSLPENVILLGEIRDQRQLAAYYSLADAVVLTSRRETFSMVTAEALCCGTPVAGFRAGGPEQIALEMYSGFAEFGDVPGLCEIITSLLERCPAPEEIACKAKQRYDTKAVCDAYLDCYRQLTGEKKE